MKAYVWLFTTKITSSCLVKAYGVRFFCDSWWSFIRVVNWKFHFMILLEKFSASSDSVSCELLQVNNHIYLPVYSQSKFMRSRISFSLLEGKMHVLWKSRGARMLSSSKFDAPSTSTRCVCLTLRKQTSWSNLCLQVGHGVFSFFHFISFMWHFGYITY